jgi:hypothetical protein
MAGFGVLLFKKKRAKKHEGKFHYHPVILSKKRA